MSTSVEDERQRIERLPAGVTLGDGTVLTFPPSRNCDCEDCIRAFEAYRKGTLRMPDDGDLPW